LEIESSNTIGSSAVEILELRMEYNSNHHDILISKIPTQFDDRCLLVNALFLRDRKDGGLFDFTELWPEEHAKVDPNRFLGLESGLI